MEDSEQFRLPLIRKTWKYGEGTCPSKHKNHSLYSC